MKFRGVLAVILAIAIAAGVYILFSTKEDNSRGAVTLWYEKGSPLACELEALVKSYNSDMKRETLPVELKCFDNESALAEAYETGSPDILLCSHLRAFSLYLKNKLTDISGEETFVAPAYSKNLTSRNSSIGNSFFPIGISVPVIAFNNNLTQQNSFGSFEDMLSVASDYAAGVGSPFLSISSVSEQYYIYLLRYNIEFDGKFNEINSDKQYLSLYNTFAEAAFEGSVAFLGDNAVTYLTESAIPCVIVSSDMLKDVEADNISVFDIPASVESLNHDTIGTAYGLAITNGGCRSTRDTTAFITWIFENNRSSQAAVDARLAPSSKNDSFKTDAIGTAIADIVKEEFVALPAADSDYMLNRDSFDESFLEKMQKLFP